MVRLEAQAVKEIWPHPSEKERCRREAEAEKERCRRDAEAALVVATGAPGRPTGMHLVQAEAQRRRKAGESLSGVKAEATALREWYVSQHSRLPPLTAKTIENKIRLDHKRHVAGQPRN